MAADGTREGSGQAIAALLQFARGGGRTFLKRQHVPYPFHVTRPHLLYAGLPDLATLILQSASGGLYRGDRLTMDITIGEGARAHVTSQAATVVHATPTSGIAVASSLAVAAGALLAVTTDPHILFPGSSLEIGTEVTLDPSANVIVAEGFASHDPSGGERPFGWFSSRLRVRRPDGVLLLDDAGAIDGMAFAGSGSPLGPCRALGAVSVLGPCAAKVNVEGLGAVLARLGLLAGATPLPNDAGLGIRLLAASGGPLAIGLRACAQAALDAATGGPNLVRRI